MSRFALRLVSSLTALAVAQLALAPAAHTCGCLVMPDPSQPVVQAGERIVFGVKNSTVEAHIQIKYQGDPKDFGWLLPLPSLPTMELGSEELFSQLEAKTAPQFFLSQSFLGNCSGPSLGCGSSSSLSRAGGGFFPPSEDGTIPGSPLVVQDSIGPYDYAVLKADDQTEMLKWLNTNRYLVPAGTDAVLKPYIHSGAYLLALKLKSGKSVGDLQPVVVRYTSDLPMIPIILTSVAATPNMGIEVFVLGQGRAIPRNYNHTVINEAALDWNNFGQSYPALINRAVAEAPKHHTFVTEFADKSGLMQGLLDPAGRFGDGPGLKALTDPLDYAKYLRSHGFTYPFSGTLATILKAYIPEPAELVASGVSDVEFYANLDDQLLTWRQAYNKTPPAIDAAGLTDEIWKRIVTPTLAAGKLFTTYPYLTRMFTTLSPNDMTDDPVFSFNTGLPTVSNVHKVTMQVDCAGDGQVTTEEGFKVLYPNTAAGPAVAQVPASLRIETLSETGAATVVTDNTAATQSLLGPAGGSGCRVGEAAAGSRGWSGVLLLTGLALVVAARARRRN